MKLGTVVREGGKKIRKLITLKIIYQKMSVRFELSQKVSVYIWISV